MSMTIVNQGSSSIGRQIITADGPTMINQGKVTIHEQVCISGSVHDNSKTTIKVRYIPPGSTCDIKDGPNIKVLKTVHGHPPKKLTVGGVRMTGGGNDTMTVGKGGSMTMTFS
jgi:hypothetical protein